MINKLLDWLFTLTIDKWTVEEVREERRRRADQTVIIAHQACEREGISPEQITEINSPVIERWPVKKLWLEFGNWDAVHQKPARSRAEIPCSEEAYRLYNIGYEQGAASIEPEEIKLLRKLEEKRWKFHQEVNKIAERCQQFGIDVNYREDKILAEYAKDPMFQEFLWATGRSDALHGLPDKTFVNNLHYNAGYQRGELEKEQLRCKN